VQALPVPKRVRDDLLARFNSRHVTEMETSREWALPMLPVEAQK
jgi:hypothetical protein